MKQRVLIYFAIVLLAVDIGLINASLVLAYYLRFQSGLVAYEILHSWRAYMALGIMESLVMPTAFALRGLSATFMARESFHSLP